MALVHDRRRCLGSRHLEERLADVDTHHLEPSPAQLVGVTTGSTADIEDTVAEPDETIIISIASVTGSVELGVAEQTVVIIDDDEPLTIEFFDCAGFSRAKSTHGR